MTQPNMHGPIHHAISGISHSNFNPRLHGNLYLHLSNLPLSEAMAALHPGGIPAFLHTTLNALLFATFTQTLNYPDCFINEIDHIQIRKPTPPHPDCQICQIVTWIITTCPNPQACITVLQYLDLITLFEINRELWCRISPKPLLVDHAFLTYTEGLDYAAALTETLFFSPLRPFEFHHLTIDQKSLALHEWRNGFAYLAYRTLKIRGEISGRVASAILSTMLVVAVLQLYAFYPNNFLLPTHHHFILDTIRLHPQAYTLLYRLSQALGSAIGELILVVDYWPGMHEQHPEDFRIEDSDWYQSILGEGVQTMIALNNTLVFTYDNDIANTFVHIQDCANFPDQCYCRFSRLLQRLYPLPE